MNPFAPLPTENPPEPSLWPALRAAGLVGLGAWLVFAVFASLIGGALVACALPPAVLVSSLMGWAASTSAPRWALGMLGAAAPLATALLAGGLAGLVLPDGALLIDQPDDWVPGGPPMGTGERLSVGIGDGMTGFFLFSPLLVPMGFAAGLWIWKMARPAAIASR